MAAFEWLFYTLLSVMTIVSNLAKSVCASENVYTIEEQQALDQFRPLVEGYVTKAYMTEDAYLLRFLQANDLQLEKAVEMLRRTMEWRTENGIDRILEEVNPVDKELPYTIGIDRGSRPVVLIKAGETDLRKVLISGKRDLAIRSGWKLVETVATKARLLNASQVVAVIDLNGFSYRRHACSDCIPFAQEIGKTIEANYPGLAAGIYFINTPRIFEVLLRVIKAILSDSSQRVLHIYGFDKGEWTEALLKIIPLEELNQLFGYSFQTTQNHIRHSSHVKHPESKEEHAKHIHDNHLVTNLSNQSPTLYPVFSVFMTFAVIGLYFNKSSK